MIKTPSWPVPLGYKPIDLELQRMYKLLIKLGSPEEKLPPVVHIAGTNGKGSTLAFLRAIIEAAGYRVHAYTSPHLVHFNERIVVSSRVIEDDFLQTMLDQCEAAAEGIPLTFFEGTTAAALLAFSKVPADIVLLETGMGGRLDATNVVARPALTAITPISLDHKEYLGDTLAKIAAEKAAIMKPRVPCVVGAQTEEAMAVIARTAEEQEAPLHTVGNAWQVVEESGDKGFSYHSEEWEFSFLRPSLSGAHQYHNAGMAIACAEQLDYLTISERAIRQGMATAQWPARMQPITTGPLLEQLMETDELWLDGGHNPGAGETIAATHQALEEKSLYLVVGMLKNKDVAGFLDPLKDVAVGVYAVSIPEEENSCDPQEIVSVAQSLGIVAQVADNVPEAIQQVATARNGPVRVIICGSLYLAGAVLEEYT